MGEEKLSFDPVLPHHWHKILNLGVNLCHHSETKCHKQTESSSCLRTVPVTLMILKIYFLKMYPEMHFILIYVVLTFELSGLSTPTSESALNKRQEKPAKHPC